MLRAILSSLGSAVSAENDTFLFLFESGCFGETLRHDFKEPLEPLFLNAGESGRVSTANSGL